MEAKFQALPPLKRFRLLQQQQEEQEQGHNKENAPPPPSVSSFQLPAKKRKESRVDPAPISTYSLPTKKRVWALHPDLILISDSKPLSPFDLNIEYNPKPTASFDQQPQSPPLPFTPCPTNQSLPEEEEENKQQIPVVDEEEITNREESIKEEEEEEEDDDGIVCAICGSTDGDPTDPIVFCDGCDLMVHSTCYGNPLVKGIPDGDWFCYRCLVSPSGDSNTSPSSCCLCPVKGGAMKPTTAPHHGSSSTWAHLVCALFVPEVFFEDPDGRDGIDCSKVPRRRWKGTCFLCESSQGCVLDCSEPTCPLAFHVTCGLKEDLCIEYKQGKKNKETIVAGFCKTHTRLWEKQQGTGKFKIVARDNKCKK
ncbi:hypothetical protein Tsubulata_008622 [Turnera subulata]|uniref:PHD-type domain-containing protein n=1 Tax=Turnera subulata TaxID=218843 RepID=A0A9Q0FPT1_9ROSI|nr:hypothetical protein Tsubulata_008622 [Turnera subulata]